MARVCQPELLGRPVAVAPVQSERGLILSVSYEAGKEGVFKGMPLSNAIKLCPDLIVLSPNPGLMERACRTLAETVARYTPIWEISRPGHIYLDVTGTGRLWGSAKDTGYRLRHEIKYRMYMSGTVGVAGNKMVSSIASRVMPSAGVLDVGHGREAPFMAPLRVDMIPGIGGFRKKILLEEMNITRVHELVALDMRRLKFIFRRQAFVIRQRALGIDPTPVYPIPAQAMVSEEVTLPQGENDDRKLLGVLYSMVEKCAYRLRKGALFPRKAGILIRYSDKIETRRQIGLSNTRFYDLDLYGPLKTLFFKACNRRVRVRFIRVWFRDFCRSSGQLSLFNAPSRAQKKKAAIIQVMDLIRERHGEAAIKYGRSA